MRSALAITAAWAAAVVGCASGDELRHSAAAAAGDVAYFHYGAGAGPALITGGDGAVTEERWASPFGVPLAPAGAPADPHGALNRPVDPSTGLSDHGARWLAPQLARWLTPDPPVKVPSERYAADPWDLHPYQYVRHNPTAFWDPDGRDLVVVGPKADELMAYIGSLTGLKLSRDKTGKVSVGGVATTKGVSKYGATLVKAIVGDSNHTVTMIAIAQERRLLPAGAHPRKADTYVLDLDDFTHLHDKVDSKIALALVGHELYEAYLYVRGQPDYGKRHEQAIYAENDMLKELGSKAVRGEERAVVKNGTRHYSVDYGTLTLRAQRDEQTLEWTDPTKK